MLFLREKLYCLFTSTRGDSSIAPSRGVILLGHFYKKGVRYTTFGPYTGGPIFEAKYLYWCLVAWNHSYQPLQVGLLLPGLPLLSKIVWVYIA